MDKKQILHVNEYMSTIQNIRDELYLMGTGDEISTELIVNIFIPLLSRGYSILLIYDAVKKLLSSGLMYDIRVVLPEEKMPIPYDMSFEECEDYTLVDNSPPTRCPILKTNIHYFKHQDFISRANNKPIYLARRIC